MDSPRTANEKSTRLAMLNTSQVQSNGDENSENAEPEVLTSLKSSNSSSITTPTKTSSKSPRQPRSSERKRVTSRSPSEAVAKQQQKKKATLRVSVPPSAEEVRVYTCGDNFYGKLGLGVDTPIVNLLSRVNSLEMYGQRIVLSAGGSHNSVFIGESQSVYICGYGKSKEKEGSSIFGDDRAAEKEPKPIDAIFPREIIQVSQGNYHIIVLTQGGLCYTWGWGGFGQLGHGDNQNLSSPKLLQMKSIRQVTAGTSYSMVVTEFGELYGFGNNQHGQLGIGTMENQNVPSKVKRLYNVQKVACGVSHTVAIAEQSSHSENSKSRRVYIWGQVKSGTVEFTPVEITSVANKYIMDVGCGEWHTVLLSQDGVIYTMDLGGNSSVPEANIKVDLRGRLIKQIHCGNFHTIAVDDNGYAYSWGKNSCGQLGREGDPKSAQRIIASIGDQVVRHVSCGDYHTVIITDNNARLQLFWKLLKKERWYLYKLLALMDHHASGLIRFLSMKASGNTGGGANGREEGNSGTSVGGDLASEVGSLLFVNVRDIVLLQRNLLKQLDQVLQSCGNFNQMDISESSKVTLGTIFRNMMPEFHVYLRYADAYNDLATKLNQLKKLEKFGIFFSDIRQQLFLEFGSTKAGSKLDVSTLMFEPIKHISRYVKHFKKILRTIARHEPEREVLQIVYENLRGLLDRLAKNFNLVNPMEILTSTLNEYGQPEIGSANLTQLVERLTYHQFIDVEFTMAFLLTYRLFTTPRKFLRSLISRYHGAHEKSDRASIQSPASSPLLPVADSSDSKSPSNSGDISTISPSASKNRRRIMSNDVQEDPESTQQLVQIRVVQVLLRWVKSSVSSYDFDDKNSELARELFTFCEEVLKKSTFAPYATAIIARLTETTPATPVVVAPKKVGAPQLPIEVLDEEDGKNSISMSSHLSSGEDRSITIC